MATLTGKQIANSYKQLLQIGSDNTGITTTLQAVQDGNGNNSPLQLTNSTLNIDGTLQLNGVALTADASALNAITDLTGITGIVAMNAGSALGRTLTAGAGIDITNSDGTAGNPTVALSATGVTSASYGPLTSFEVNQYGQVTSATAVSATLSVPNIYATDFYGERLHLSDRLSVTGDSRLVGAVSVDSNITVDGNAVVKGSANITGDVSSSGNIKVIHVSASGGSYVGTVSAGFFVGDGSGLINVPSATGGTVKFIKAGTGIKITVDGAVSSSIPVSGTILVSADQNFGTVSVSTAIVATGSALFGTLSATNIDADELLIAGVSAANVTEVAAVSALTQINLDSITSINTVVANVSALTSVNAAAITSINAVIEGNVSADSGTFNTLTVVTSATIGDNLTVAGTLASGAITLPNNTNYYAKDTVGTAQNVAFIDGTNTLRIGDTDLNDVQIQADGTNPVAQFDSGGLTLNTGDVTTLRGQFAGRNSAPSSGIGVEIYQVANQGEILAYNRTTPGYVPLRINGASIDLSTSGTTALTIDSSQNATFSAQIKLDGSSPFITATGTGNTVRVAGGNATNDGGNIALYGSTTATNAGDILFRSGSTQVALWDESLNQWAFNGSSVDINGGTLASGAITINDGDAGSYTPNPAGDDLVIESSGNTGMTLAAPDANSVDIILGNPTTQVGALIQWNHNGTEDLIISASKAGSNLKLKSSGTTALTIDSSQNVGIGSSTIPAGVRLKLQGGNQIIDRNGVGYSVNGNADDLAIMNSGSFGINLIGEATAGIGYLMFGNNSDSSRGGLKYTYSTDELEISTAGPTAAITIDSSQNATFTGTLASGTHTINPGGSRTSSGSTENIIITNSASTGDKTGIHMTAGNTGTSTIRFGVAADDTLASITSTNSTTTATLKLAAGNGNTNLTLSGTGGSESAVFAGTAEIQSGVYIGGNAAANLLDDYEEGTHVTTVTPGTSGTITLNSAYDELQYTKVGNVCHIQGQIITTSVSSPVGSYITFTLPFTSVSGLGKRSSFSVTSFGLGGGSTYSVMPTQTVEAGTLLYIYLDASTVQASDQFYIGGSYETA